MLANNYSPSFNWRKALAFAKIASFQCGIAQMGYRLQFVTLAGFHSLNLTKFNRLAITVGAGWVRATRAGLPSVDDLAGGERFSPPRRRCSMAPCDFW